MALAQTGNRAVHIKQHGAAVVIADHALRPENDASRAPVVTSSTCTLVDGYKIMSPGWQL